MKHLVRDEGVAGSNPATPTTFPSILPSTRTASRTASSRTNFWLHERPVRRVIQCAPSIPRQPHTNAKHRNAGGARGFEFHHSGGYR
jgi:hypothetical protein